MKKFLLALLLIACKPASAETGYPQPFALKVDATRTVTVKDEIGRDTLPVAEQIAELAKDSHEPIYIMINSPGGSVLHGLQVVQAMETAQARGVQFKCVVNTMAASMAFVIYAQCDERYAYKYSLLLWHEMRMGTNGTISVREAEAAAAAMRQLEEPLIEMMIKALDMPRDVWMMHYYAETFWTAAGLLRSSPLFLTIINDVYGLEEE